MPKELTVDKFLKDYEKKNPGMYSSSNLTNKMRLKDFAIKFAKEHRKRMLKSMKQEAESEIITSPVSKKFIILDGKKVFNAYPKKLIK